MSTYTITLHTDTAAFDDRPEQETARILRKLADRIEAESSIQSSFILLKDVNGNRVGYAEFKPVTPGGPDA